MQSLKQVLRTTLLSMLLALTAGLALQPVHAAPGGKGGGGGKVSVTEADPREADQGKTLDVWIIGDGFDEGSTAKFLVSGTSDDSQVIVNSTTYETSTGKLRSNITVKGEALATEYDIEVRNSSGRRGKGTTLFRVKEKVDETACTGLEDPSPEIAYLTALTLDGDYETQDLYLSSASGCDQYLLLEDAAVKVPGDVYNGQQEPGPYLWGVRGLRLDVEGDQGVVIWRDEEFEIDRLYALSFDISPTGGVTADPSGPVPIFFAPAGAEVHWADVRFNSANEIELVVRIGYRSGGELVERQLVYANATTMESIALMTGDCPVRDAASNCYIPDAFRPWWSEDGSEVYVNLYDPVNFVTAIGRVQKGAQGWADPVTEVLMTNESQVTIIGLKPPSAAWPSGLLAYLWLNYVERKKGRTNFKETQSFASSIEPGSCSPTECVPTDGYPLAVDTKLVPQGFLRDGGMLFIDVGPGAQRNIGAYSDPFTGVIGPLEIPDVDRGARDTTY